MNGGAENKIPGLPAAGAAPPGSFLKSAWRGTGASMPGSLSILTHLNVLELSRKQLTIALGLVLAVGTIALYCPVLWHEFVNYDDQDYILNNPHVNAGLRWPGIVWAFTHSYAANWHPLTWISHMLDCQLFGTNAPGAHHMMNVLFHAANAVLLFILLNNMTRAPWRSFFVAALFAWHPLHVESVAWASERKDVLSGFFWMLTLLCFARYGRDIALRCPRPYSGRNDIEKSTVARNPSEGIAPLDAARTAVAAPLAKSAGPTIFYMLALLFFACGLMSKPMVVTLPFVLLLLDFWPLQRFNVSTFQRLLLEKLPFFALMAASCVITLSAQKGAMWSTASLPFSFRFANTLMAYVRYLSKIFIPTNLALIYPYPHLWPLLGVAAAGTVLVLITVIFIVQAKRFPYLPVGWFWFLGTLVPVIGLVQVGVQSIADRYTYLPSIGIFILVVWGISDLVASSARRLETCAIAGAGALIGCLVLTSIQLRYWHDSIAIFTHTVRVTSDNYAAYDCLGKSWQNKGRLDHAGDCYAQAVQLEPDYPLAQFDLGMDLVALGDSANASNHLATAIQLWPGNADMQYDFGVFLSQHGDATDAAAHLKAALAIQPDFPQAQKELNSVETLKR